MEQGQPPGAMHLPRERALTAGYYRSRLVRVLRQGPEIVVSEQGGTRVYEKRAEGLTVTLVA